MGSALEELEAGWRADPENPKAARALARAYAEADRAEEAYDLLYDLQAFKPGAAWIDAVVAELKGAELKALKRRLGAGARFAAFREKKPSSPGREIEWLWQERDDFQREPYPARAITIFNGQKVLKALIKSLKDFPALRDLNFWTCKGLSDESLGAVAALPRLRALNISFNAGITDAGLVGMEAPQDFKIMFCDNIRGPGLAHLRGVRSIDLMKTPVSDEGIGYLSGATSLRLGDSPTITGASFDRLQAARKIIAFRLPLIPEAFEHLAALPRLEDLELSATYKLRGQDLAPLASSKSLRRLDLSLCYKVRDEHIAALAGAPILEEIDLSQTEVTAKILDILKEFPKLRRFEAAENKIDPQAIAKLQAELAER